MDGRSFILRVCYSLVLPSPEDESTAMFLTDGTSTYLAISTASICTYLLHSATPMRKSYSVFTQYFTVLPKV